MALASAAVALTATRMGWSWLLPTPWALCFAAVMASAWFGGRGPSLLATATMAILGFLFFFEPYGSTAHSRPSLMATVVFVAVSLFISGLASARRRAEIRESDERRRFQATVASIGDAVIATDAQGRVTFMNAVAESMTGWFLYEASGRHLDEVFRIVHETSRQVTPSPVAKVLATGKIQGMANHTVLIARDGTEIAIDDSASPIRDEHDAITGVVIIFRDITTARSHEHLLEEQKTVLELVARGAPLADTLDALCRMIEGQSQAGLRASILLLDDDGVRLRHGAAPSLPEAYSRAIDGLEIGAAVGSCGSAAYLREPVDVADIATDPRWANFADLALGHGLAACWSRPIFSSDGAVLGTFAMYDTSPRSPRDEDLRLVDLVTRTAAIAIARKKTEETLRRNEDRFRFLDALSQATRSMDDASQVMAATTKMLGEHLGVTRCAFADVEPDADHFTIRNDWTDGAPSSVGSYVLTAIGSQVASVLRSGGTLVVRDVAVVLSPEDGATALAAMGIQAVACRPFVKNGKLAAMMAVHQANPRDWTADEVTLLSEVAERSWAHVERIRSEASRRDADARRTDQLRHLTEIAARINAAHDLNSVVGVVTAEARQLIGARLAETRIQRDPSTPPIATMVSGVDRTEPEPDDPAALALAAAAAEAVRLARSIRTTSGAMATPLVSRSGEVLGAIALGDKGGEGFRDDDEVILVQLSHVAAVAIENAGLYEELRANDRRKDEFLAMLAHELRNPLAAINNAAGVAARGDRGADLDWSLDVIHRQGKHLSRMIDDLLDASRISSGKIDLHRSVIEITPILKSASQTAQAIMDERHHNFQFEPVDAALWANVDPTRLEQIVVNLLNNAAKYSENGGRIRLSAHLEGDIVEIRVVDNGLGIPPESLPAMFTLFAQGNRSLARSEGGLGIGLTVVKKLTELHGGTVVAHSEGLGKGSTFAIRLPRAQPVEAGRIVDPGKPPRDTPRAARVLVVDDSVDTARGLARLLKILGHEVATANDGLEALEAARRDCPDFVLLDIGLPGMDGYEVAARLRTEASCETAVIVAISGYGMEDDRRRTREAGFNHHMVKPIDTDALLHLLTTSPLPRDAS